MEINSKFLSLILLIFFSNSIIFSFSHDLDINNNAENIINNYYSSHSPKEPIIYYNFDTFYSNNVNRESNATFKFSILNDTEEIFFDYQSEFGCLYVDFYKNQSSDFPTPQFNFCSYGENKIFSLTKYEILQKIQEDSIKDLNFDILVSYSEGEIDKITDFDFSLKVSLRKPDINILEIKSGHKTLCKPEKVGNYYRCLFILTTNEELTGDNIIIYSNSQDNKIKFKTYVNLINKNIYDNWEDYNLFINIPSSASSDYNNSNCEEDFVIVEKKSEKYIYISIELSNFAIMEIMAQTILYNSNTIPEKNYAQTYSINNKNISLNFNNLLISGISLSLTTLYGKARVYLKNEQQSINYITDTIENKLLFQINLEKCKNGGSCILYIDNLGNNQVNEKDYIFYISYTTTPNNNINELTYGKSHKFLYTNLKYPLILYQQIYNFPKDLDINLVLYNEPNTNIVNDMFNIGITLVPKNDIYKLKLNNDLIKNYSKIKLGKFDYTLLASNIHLTAAEMINFEVLDDAYLVIYLTNNNNDYDLDKLILGTSIYQMDSLIYPSERIYHYGQLNNQRVVYRLKGHKEYHLMRLEFGSNNNKIVWSVKRTYDNENFNKNDTDLSFVTEKWINGRELLTMYIENGEDIYLTINSNSESPLNYVFKYYSSAKNGDFKNYRIVDDAINYNKNTKEIVVNKIGNVPSSSLANYYLKVIEENNYTSYEDINTIAIIESSANLTKIGTDNNNIISFNLNNCLNRENTYYLNVYCIISENNADFEYIAYSGFMIKGKTISKANKNFIYASFGISGFIVLIIIIGAINLCVKARKRKLSRARNRNNRNLYGYRDDLLDY